MSHLAKAMQEHGTRSIYDISEFDQWINVAQRKDINELLDRRGEGNVFGLKLNPLEVIPGSKLRDVCNFGVDYVFSNEGGVAIRVGLAMYENKENYVKMLDALEKLALDTCMWV